MCQHCSQTCSKLLLGDAPKEGTPISVNPLVIWAWLGLLVNAIHSIPAGELDGGRIDFALWGRKASSHLLAASIELLGLASLLNDILLGGSDINSAKRANNSSIRGNHRPSG